MAVVAAVAGRNSQNTTSTCGGSVFLCDRYAHRGRHALHQSHWRTTWRQALSLLHLRVRQLKLNETEVRRMHILAVGRGLEGGGAMGTGTAMASCEKPRKRLVTQIRRQQFRLDRRSVITALRSTIRFRLFFISCGLWNFVHTVFAGLEHT